MFLSRRKIASLGALVSLTAGNALFAAPPGFPHPVQPRPAPSHPIGFAVPRPVGIVVRPPPVIVVKPPPVIVVKPPPVIVVKPPPVIVGIPKPPPYPVGIVIGRPVPRPIGIVIGRPIPRPIGIVIGKPIPYPHPIGIIVIPPRPPIIIGIVVRPPPFPPCPPHHRPYWPRPYPYPVPVPVPVPYPVGPGPVIEPPPVAPPPVAPPVEHGAEESWQVACVGTDTKHPLKELTATFMRTNTEAWDMDAQLKINGKNEPFKADAQGTIGEAAFRLSLPEQGGFQLEPRKDDKGNTVYVGGVKLPGEKDSVGLQCNVRRTSTEGGPDAGPDSGPGTRPDSGTNPDDDSGN